MKLIADTHTHTVASTHAYSTILENAKFASELGLLYLAMTDHAPALCDAPHIWHITNMRTLPDYMYGVRILKGAEANIQPLNATENGFDLTDEQMQKLEWVVASIHAPCYPKASLDEVTRSYINAAKNPNIDVIAHSGHVYYPYDYEKAVKVFKEYGKLVEINEHSFEARAEGIKNCLEIAKLCKKYETGIVINSDAHFAYSIGECENAKKLLQEIDFPQKLIINSDKDLFEEYLSLRKKRVQG